MQASTKLLPTRQSRRTSSSTLEVAVDSSAGLATASVRNALAAPAASAATAVSASVASAAYAASAAAASTAAAFDAVLDSTFSAVEGLEEATVGVASAAYDTAVNHHEHVSEAFAGEVVLTVRGDHNGPGGKE